MEYLLTTLVVSLLLPLVLSLYIPLIRRRRPKTHLSPPPGNSSLPFIGETLTFLSYQFNSDPLSFSAQRIHKYGRIFSTRLFGGMTVMSNTASFHRLLFTNENTLVSSSWPSSLHVVLGDGSLLSKAGSEGKRLRSAIMTFLVPSALQRYVGRVDAIAVKHLKEQWDGKEVVGAYELLKKFTFAVACDLFVSVTNSVQEEELLEPFNAVMAGLFAVPITLPWTKYYKAKKAGMFMRQRFRVWIEKRRRKEEKQDGMAKDLLSCLLNYKDEDGKPLRDEEIADNILTVLMAGHDTTRALLTVVMKYLADYKWCYDEIVKEQLAIKATKKAEEPLNWGDLQRMQYSWWTIQETLRIQPLSFGAFRKALQDIEYEGYMIPKGWKLYWGPNTHHESQYFPNPEKFDPTRFSSAPTPYTFVLLGGGPRMCPGSEFTRMLSLVFLHHVVTRYRWTLLHPNECFFVNILAFPSDGLHIKLSPSAVSNNQ